MSGNDKGGLGRGLGALLPRGILGQSADAIELVEDDGATDASGRPSSPVGATVPLGTVRDIEIGSIKPNPKQPRAVFDDRALDELAGSIREVGVLQPVIVRPNAEGGLELVAGERRLRASLRAGRSTVPAIVREDDDERSLLSAFIENVQRVDLNPLEEAAAYRTIIDDLGATHDDVGRRVGKSRAAVTNALRLLHLAPEVQRRVADGELSPAHARTIAALADPAQQVAAAQRVIADALNVRATEQLVKELAERQPLTERAVQTRAARAAARDERPAGVLEAEGLLSDRLETRVRVDHTQSGRGRIVIDYAGVGDLARIVDAIAPTTKVT